MGADRIFRSTVDWERLAFRVRIAILKTLTSGDTANAYAFKPDIIYNIECSRVINKKYFISGAQSDICHPEVAHVIWEAARVEVPQPSPAPVPPAPGPA